MSNATEGKRRIVLGAVSIQNEGRVLLVSSKKDFGEFTGCWMFPGGGVESGESLKEAVVREFQEELGIAVRPHTLLQEAPNTLGALTSWFLCDPIPGSTRLFLESKLAGGGMFTHEEALRLPLWPDARAFIEQFKQQLFTSN